MIWSLHWMKITCKNAYCQEHEAEIRKHIEKAKEQ